MDIHATAIGEVKILQPRIFDDERGFLVETWRQEEWKGSVSALDLVQDNHSRSTRGVLRGLHFQEPKAHGKLVRVSRGEIFDVAVDVRLGSPTFGRWVGVTLSDKNQHQLWVPPGFAHGFLVLSDIADVPYRATGYYAPDCEHTVSWNDPDIGIDWPLGDLDGPVLSERDRGAVRLRDLPEESLAVFNPADSVG